MKTNKFLLLLNANGISYKVCKKLKGMIYKTTVILNSMSLFLPEYDITANDFNLSAYDLWPQELQLTWKEKPALKSLIGK